MRTTATGPRHATALVACRGVGVLHGAPGGQVVALADVTLELRGGERVAICGRSGSGKTTLLHVMGGLVEPTSGSVEWDGTPLAALGRSARASVRRGGVAYVFQRPCLLPYFSARQNVHFAAARDGEAAPDELLALVGLAAKGEHLPAELSGGEQQRVAIARALAQRPRLLICDEPTGQLDADTGRRVLALIDALQDRLGFTLAVGTHDAAVRARLSRRVELDDGRVVADEQTP